MSHMDIINRLRKQADELEAAQNQAANMRSIAAPQAIQANPPIAQPQQDISKLVAAEVARQIAPQASPIASMLSIIGKAFTDEQQIWITANIAKLPGFIQSSNGKEALNMLLEEFQEFTKEK